MSMFSGIFDLIAGVLAFFYELPVVGGSYGVAIILLTGAVMMLLMPLTVRATRSTLKMQAVQPKLKALQKKHAGDKAKLNQEMMALYQSEGINPVGGCLPMLAQLPVFLVLFNVLRGLSRRIDETPYYAIVEQARSLAGAEASLGHRFDPKYLDAGSEMYQNLNGSEEMKFLVFDLAKEALEVVRGDFVEGIPYVMLIMFVVGTSYYQQRQMSSRRKKQPNSQSSPINSQQEMILKFLPILSGVWSFVFPLGLVTYWATSNVFRIGQQAYITRTVYRSDNPALQVDDDDEDEDDDAENATSDDTAKSKNGGAKGARKPRATGSADNSSADNGDGLESHGVAGAEANGIGNRADYGEQMRREKALKQTRKRSRDAEQSSRTTPKGTKPGSKSKRKR